MANETTMMTMHPDYGHSSSMTEKKYVYKEDNDEYASKGVGGTALGIGIGALALTLLNRNNVLGGLLGGNNETQGCAVTCAERMADMKEYHNQMFGLYKNQVDADFSNYKFARDLSDSILAKHNADSFSLYQGYTNQGIALQKEIDDLKTRMAVNEAVEPWKFKEVYSAIALEKERREANDCSIVGYVNCQFIPNYIADITPATTSTQKTNFNPLSCNQGYCNCR